VGALSPIFCAHCTTLIFFRGPSVRDINWYYIGDAVPAFLTLIIIPLSYKYAHLSAFPRCCAEH
jgi:xanthine/uracil/vitamin C permease (AzgA family)